LRHPDETARNRGGHGERDRVPALGEVDVHHRADARGRRRNNDCRTALLPRHHRAGEPARTPPARLIAMSPPDALEAGPPAAAYAHTRRPVTIGNLRLPHRVVMGSMHLNLETGDGRALAAFYAERAAAGAGLIITGGAAVNRVGAGGRGYALIHEPEHEIGT